MKVFLCVEIDVTASEPGCPLDPDAVKASVREAVHNAVHAAANDGFRHAMEDQVSLGVVSVVAYPAVDTGRAKPADDAPTGRWSSVHSGPQNIAKCPEVSRQCRDRDYQMIEGPPLDDYAPPG